MRTADVVKITTNVDTLASSPWILFNTRLLREKAEAPGNRTQQRRLSTTPVGFEVREGHQTLFAS
ncbi:uncharacterized protein METZ01_LOCUS405320, partial [marine metagenome]